MLVPITLVILFFALYPQLALKRSERSVKGAVLAAQSADGQLLASTCSSERSPATLLVACFKEQE